MKEVYSVTNKLTWYILAIAVKNSREVYVGVEIPPPLTTSPMFVYAASSNGGNGRCIFLVL